MMRLWLMFCLVDRPERLNGSFWGEYQFVIRVSIIICTLFLLDLVVKINHFSLLLVRRVHFTPLI